MFGAMLLSCLYNSSVSEKTTAGVIVCCVIGCISNGALMIVQKLFGVYAAGQSLTVFNLFTFCLCALFSVLVLIVIKAYNKVHNVAQIPSDFSYRKSALPIVLLGGSIFIINWTMTTLAGIIDAAVLFPVATGVTLSLIAIVSSVMFKEKLKLLSILSIVVMIGGVILLNL